MSGIDLARRLREIIVPSPLLLIALTGSSDADIRDACLAAGFDAYLTKGRGLGDLERLLASAPGDVSAATGAGGRSDR
jgi:CheY-like chemotaxis protein